MLADRKTSPNPDAMRRAAKVLGVPVPTTRGLKSDRELLGNLRVEITKRLDTVRDDDHIKCVVCDEVATEDTDFCPYCGDEGTGTEAEAVKIASTKKPAAPVDDDVEAEVVDEDETPAPDEEADEESDEDDDSADDESDDEAADESDEEEADEAPEPTASVGIAAAGAVVAKDVGAGLQALSRELDQSLQRITDMKRNAVGLSYDIGIECKAIRDKQLFKARGYPSFKAFAEKELPFTRESALQLITIVEKHSREDYGQIGYAKMRVISAVSDSVAKEKLLNEARSGKVSTREVSERAAAAGGSGRTRKKVVTPAAEKGEKITLIGKVGAKKQIVKFRNESEEVIPNVGMFYAKGLIAQAYGELEISDGVVIRIGLRLGQKNELEGLSVRFVRAE